MTTATENPYIGSTRAADRNRLKQWNIGRADRLAGKPCGSTNGAYLEGWYSVTPPQDLDLKLQAMIHGERVVVGDLWMDDAARTDYGSEIRTCRNRHRCGIHDAYVAWISDDAKPEDLEFHDGYAIGSL